MCVDCPKLTPMVSSRHMMASKASSSSMGIRKAAGITIRDGYVTAPILPTVALTVRRMCICAARSAGIASEEDHPAPLICDTHGSGAEESIGAENQAVNWAGSLAPACTLDSSPQTILFTAVRSINKGNAGREPSNKQRRIARWIRSALAAAFCGARDSSPPSPIP
jgi:hypothetical protein